MKQNNPESDRPKVTILSKKDLRFSYFAGPGKGGQNKNKVHTGCQINHDESGAIGRASDSRSLDLNKRAAFERLVKDPRMKFWLAKKIYELKHMETMEETVAREMQSQNLKLEILGPDGKWMQVSEQYFDSELARTCHD